MWSGAEPNTQDKMEIKVIIIKANEIKRVIKCEVITYKVRWNVWGETIVSMVLSSK